VKALRHESNTPFEAELHRAQVPILGFLVRMTGNLADARDILQLTSLTAWEKRDSFSEGSNFVAWMRAIALNHYRNENRKSQTRATVPLLDSDLEQMVETRHLEREREDARKRRLLQLCLEKLPERQREVIDRFYLDGLSLEHLGTESNRKPNAIAQLLHRARQNLIQCVRQMSHPELEGETFHEI
jgi:RNA polymerase sigma-70 factor (ECF subfamily)